MTSISYKVKIQEILKVYNEDIYKVQLDLFIKWVNNLLFVLLYIPMSCRNSVHDDLLLCFRVQGVHPIQIPCTN